MIVFVNAFLAPYNDKRIYFSLSYETMDKAKEAVILNQERYVGTFPIEVSDESYYHVVGAIAKEKESKKHYYD